MTYFSQMAGLAVQNFISAGVGIAVAIAVIRGFASRSGTSLGNFWQDLTRTLLYVLLPISFVGALFLVSQGVIQNLVAYTSAGDQTLALGPVASQEVIKMLGTNGGGFFNVNSAMPFENPSGLSNFVEMLLILLIPAALTSVFGRLSATGARAGPCSPRCSPCSSSRWRSSTPPRVGQLAGPARGRSHRGEPRGQGGALRYRELARCSRRSRRSPRAGRSTPPSIR